MAILILFAFIGGIVTILSPCILPILPLVLSGTVTGGKRRPYGVITGFIASFTFFTLFLSSIVKATGLSADTLRMVAVFTITVFGLGLLIPKLQEAMERAFSKIAGLGASRQTGDGFVSGFIVGLSLGLVWTPCVGPILASIITLAATSTVTAGSAIITLSYAAGTAIPLFAITVGGRNLLTRHPWLIRHTKEIQQTFGVLMLVTALAIFNSWDRKFQAFIITAFPRYGTGLTTIEDNPLVRDRLNTVETAAKHTAPELIAGGTWINSDPLTLQSLRGKVVLVDFWTYTCINCIRTLPYLKSWWDKYKDKGLVIIGVHTPEFEFEKNTDNVSKAVKDFGITYPVMQDNDYATWQAYENHYWPAKYLIDKTGVVRDTHFGEGAYDETERLIQQLLSESGSAVYDPINNPSYDIETRTPETYLGAIRGDYSRITTTGAFRRTEEYTNPSAGSSLTYTFDAMDVYLVMRPKSDGVPTTVRVTLDGKPVGTYSGNDVHDGIVSVDANRLYHLIHLPSGQRHILNLEFLNGNVELFAFTFG